MADELWRHPEPASTPMWRFLQSVREKRGLDGEDYQSLYKWSVDNVGDFWEDCWDFVGVEASVNRGKVSSPGNEGRMEDLARWGADGPATLLDLK